MRPPSRVARRYANALFHIARRENAVDAVAADLALMSDTLEANPRVLEAMAIPRVPAARKKAALQAIVGSRLGQAVTRRFLDMMVDHARESSLPETAAAFSMLADEANGIVAAEIRTAFPLSDEQTQRLQARLDGLTGRKTRMSFTTDDTLVGGMIVRIGDTVMDGSVKGYLEQVGNRLRNMTMPAVGS